MIRTQVKAVVARPVEAAFAYLADFSHLPEYDPWVKRVELTSPSATGVGATWMHEAVQQAAADLLTDEGDFIDVANSPIWIAQEHVVHRLTEPYDGSPMSTVRR